MQQIDIRRGILKKKKYICPSSDYKTLLLSLNKNNDFFCNLIFIVEKILLLKKIAPYGLG